MTKQTEMNINVKAVNKKEAKERIVTYNYDEKETDIIIDVNGKIIINLPVGDFIKMADTLYQEVNNAKKKKKPKERRPKERKL